MGAPLKDREANPKRVAPTVSLLTILKFLGLPHLSKLLTNLEERVSIIYLRRSGKNTNHHQKSWRKRLRTWKRQRLLMMLTQALEPSQKSLNIGYKQEKPRRYQKRNGLNSRKSCRQFVLNSMKIGRTDKMKMKQYTRSLMSMPNVPYITLWICSRSSSSKIDSLQNKTVIWTCNCKEIDIRFIYLKCKI